MGCCHIITRNIGGDVAVFRIQQMSLTLQGINDSKESLRGLSDP